MNKFYEITKNKKPWILFSGILFLSVSFFLLIKNSRILEITNQKKISSISGGCDESKRPIAIMFASDPVARPLSGVTMADIVIEMPVNQDGVTRMMAIFKCTIPEEIGSVRSARKDFIPLAAGFDAILAHWGGEHRALDDLNNGIIDNIDGLKYENIYFYRKTGVPRPHNGFTNDQLLYQAIKLLNYRDKTNLFNFSLTKPLNSYSGYKEGQKLDIDYSGAFKVLWTYDPVSGFYKRIRGNAVEIDKNTNSQVQAKSILLITTDWTLVNVDYIDVRTIGEGRATLYRDGFSLNGTWRKDKTNLASPLEFLDFDGNRIDFLSGQTWIEIVTPN